MLCVQVFHRRTDGSIDFYRDWSAYEDGFGDRKEFWLGDYLRAHISKYIREYVIYPFNMMIVYYIPGHEAETITGVTCGAVVFLNFKFSE